MRRVETRVLANIPPGYLYPSVELLHHKTKVLIPSVDLFDPASDITQLAFFRLINDQGVISFGFIRSKPSRDVMSSFYDKRRGFTNDSDRIRVLSVGIHDDPGLDGEEHDYQELALGVRRSRLGLIGYFGRVHELMDQSHHGYSVYSNHHDRITLLRFLASRAFRPNINQVPDSEIRYILEQFERRSLSLLSRLDGGELIDPVELIYGIESTRHAWSSDHHNELARLQPAYLARYKDRPDVHLIGETDFSSKDYPGLRNEVLHNKPYAILGRMVVAERARLGLR